MKKKTRSTGLLLPLAALTVIFLITTTFADPQISFPREAPEFDLSLIPIYTGGRFLHPQLYAGSALVIDPVSGTVLYEKNPDLIVPPASTTKMVSGLVVLEDMQQDEAIIVPKLDVEPQVMKLFPGEKIKVRDLLYGVLVWSANDAAEVLAQAYPGGRVAFSKRMNDMVASLGMFRTHFTNPSGLPEENHYSTARDLALFASVAMKNHEFARMVGTQEVTVHSLDRKIPHRLVNLNELLGKVPGVLGVKTGFLDDTGGALVTYVERKGHPVVVVVLNSWDRFGESEKLIEWAYDNYEWEDPQSPEITRRSSLR